MLLCLTFNVRPSNAEPLEWALESVYTASFLETMDNQDGDKTPADKEAGICCQPTTLFQWSYGTVTRGPDPAASMNTDRPDFTESSRTVGQGVTQWELGYTYSYNDDDGVQARSHNYPEALLRAGILADWLELRVGWCYAEQVAQTTGGSRERSYGSEDLYLGVKIGLTPQDGWLPEMALIPQTMVPIGSGGLTAGECLPGINWIYSWELNDRWVVAGQTQLNRALDTATNRPFLDVSQSATMGLGITERLGGYLEWYVMIPDGADVDPTLHYLNGGFTFAVNEDLQLDARVGRGLSQSADDYFAGSGLVFRY
jgi:hypothetical protein